MITSDFIRLEQVTIKSYQDIKIAVRNQTFFNWHWKKTHTKWFIKLGKALLTLTSKPYLLWMGWHMLIILSYTPEYSCLKFSTISCFFFLRPSSCLSTRASPSCSVTFSSCSCSWVMRSLLYPTSDTNSWKNELVCYIFIHDDKHFCFSPNSLIY